MDSQTEFPMPDDTEREAISIYLQMEHKFMATKDFYEATYNRQHRKNAVSRIARLFQGEGVDAYVAYLAMNYFDRYASRNSFEDEEYGKDNPVNDIVCFIATCCYTIAVKKRTDEFNLQKFLKKKIDLNNSTTEETDSATEETDSANDETDSITSTMLPINSEEKDPDSTTDETDIITSVEPPINSELVAEDKKNYLIYNPDTITKMEIRINSQLNWAMPPITPFCFLNYYYTTFQSVGGFKRGSINEIIVQSQGDHRLTQFKPSDIAKSAFLAATYVGYPSMFNAIKQSVDQPGELVDCWRQLVSVCHRSIIEIRSASGAMISPTTKVGYVRLLISRARQEQVEAEISRARQERVQAEIEANPKEQDKGKARVGIFNSQIIEEEVVAPKELMNFGLKWPTSHHSSDNIVKWLRRQELDCGEVLPKPNINALAKNENFDMKFGNLFRTVMEAREDGESVWKFEASDPDESWHLTLVECLLDAITEAISIRKIEDTPSIFEIEARYDQIDIEYFEKKLLDMVRESVGR